MPFLSEFKKREISLYRDQDKWLKAHKSEINYSGYMRDCTDNLIRNFEKQKRALQKGISIPTGRY